LRGQAARYARRTGRRRDWLLLANAGFDGAGVQEGDLIPPIRRHGALKDPARIARWDVSFYRERLRAERFAIDQESLRRYFPTQAAVEWMLDISSRLYGLRFERATVPVWQEEVLYLDVRDAESGTLIGGIYLDLYPRDGKYKHAAAWPVRGVSRRASRRPVSVLVTNFDRQGLTHDELETLLHEFGHVLHGVLSDTEYLDELRDVAARAAAVPVLVAIDPEDRVLGGVAYVPGPGTPLSEAEREGEAGIRMLAVDPAVGGRGIGRALTEACMARAQTEGRVGMTLFTLPTMGVAHRLYESLGFARDPDRDWEYMPGEWLWSYAIRFERGS
jgi:ribosomal protein S18 acetylase RimI-like enzyme